MTKSHIEDGNSNDSSVKNVSVPQPDNAEEALANVHRELCRVFWETWRLNHAASKLPDEKYARLSVVSLTCVASLIAVDVGLTEGQFIGACQANFNEAYEKAPKFG